MYFLVVCYYGLLWLLGPRDILFTCGWMLPAGQAAETSQMNDLAKCHHNIMDLLAATSHFVAHTAVNKLGVWNVLNIISMHVCTLSAQMVQKITDFNVSSNMGN